MAGPSLGQAKHGVRAGIAAERLLRSARRGPAVVGQLRGRRVAVALCLLGIGYASLFQSYSWNQTASFDLIRALSHGQLTIDPYQANTGDKAFYHGHWYSARAPGLAMFCLPAFELLKAVGLEGWAHHNPAQPNGNLMIPLVGIWGNVLPAMVGLAIIWWVGERLAPPFGLAAAFAVGLGTLVLPLGTLLFTHMLAACLALAAFALAFAERQGNPRPLRLAVAGALAGYATTSEYPLFLAAVAVGLYAVLHPLARGMRARLGRAGAYGAGLGLGLLPLAIFNLLAYGSPLHVAYDNIPRQQQGFFGIKAPSLHVAITLLLSSRGLFTTAPVLLVAVVGVVVLHRQGRRAEAWLIAAICALYLTYNSGYWLPFGGASPGPRFLLPAVAFLAIGLAPAFSRLPRVGLALAAASIVVTVVATLTHPLVGYETEVVRWSRELFAGNFQPTIASSFGLGRSFGAVWPFPLAVLAATACAWPQLHGALAARPSRCWETAGAVAALAAWGLFAAAGPTLLGIDHQGLVDIARAEGIPGLVRYAQRYGSYPLGQLVGIAVAAGTAALGVARLASIGGGGRPSAPLLGATTVAGS